MTTAAAFDAAAASYDQELTEHPLGRWLRGRVHERLDALFPAGARVLELGCGTGEDATWLATRGVHVTATDVSKGMLDVTRSKALAAGVSERLEIRQLDLNDLPASMPTGGFDGAYSNFGAVNCVRDRRRLGRWLATGVKPGGRLLLVPMPRFCLFEIAFHALRLRPAVAMRRWRDGQVAHAGAGGYLRTWYPSPGTWARELAPAFKVTDVQGLGLILPTTDLRHLVSRFPRFFASLESLDRTLCGLPGAARLSDHFLLELSRTAASSPEGASTP